MRKVVGFSIACLLSGLMLAACGREQGVEAGSDSDTYQPRPAPSRANQTENAKKEVSGEFVRVNMSSSTLMIRLENGMEQTFSFDDNTVVTGLESQPQRKPVKPGNVVNAGVQNLFGKEGSEVTVRWDDSGNAKLARNIDVTQVNTTKNHLKKQSK
jgi:hypothetical protein